MWNINPRKMCTQHLLGEHVEMHMFVGSINKGIKLDGYIAKGLVETNFIRNRHDIIVKELVKRGIVHGSPLPQYKYPVAGKVNKAENEIVLINRCEKCRKLSERLKDE